MFYLHESDSTYHSDLNIVWLAATQSPQSAVRKLSRRTVNGVDVLRVCKLIMQPSQPTALHITSNLMYGVARVYQQQCHFCYVDVAQISARLRAQLFRLPTADVGKVPLTARQGCRINGYEPWSGISSVAPSPGGHVRMTHDIQSLASFDSLSHSAWPAAEPASLGSRYTLPPSSSLDVEGAFRPLDMEPVWPDEGPDDHDLGLLLDVDAQAGKMADIETGDSADEPVDVDRRHALPRVLTKRVRHHQPVGRQSLLPPTDPEKVRQNFDRVTCLVEHASGNEISLLWSDHGRPRVARHRSLCDAITELPPIRTSSAIALPPAPTITTVALNGTYRNLARQLLCASAIPLYAPELCNTWSRLVSASIKANGNLPNAKRRRVAKTAEHNLAEQPSNAEHLVFSDHVRHLSTLVPDTPAAEPEVMRAGTSRPDMPGTELLPHQSAVTPWHLRQPLSSRDSLMASSSAHTQSRITASTMSRNILLGTPSITSGMPHFTPGFDLDVDMDSGLALDEAGRPATYGSALLVYDPALEGQGPFDEADILQATMDQDTELFYRQARA
ncbi:Rec8 like protein-domain-containing protein [Thamnocephalis sphaerospora]|uniref:Rec8 like protein-domain-containing protein n=1 Tax=Thamnocephalis sphaerospora TaxID=78915 RepID=A0A4P9XPE5_9FUNG|nr:Rec8 like protein-domain-containing protein [Thamnocephalis sphaerospora]|eukprot:RKP07874.1 Rec8 like protein-domain-containing protein [Thamnocephalis sphaerospora]